MELVVYGVRGLHFQTPPRMRRLGTRRPADAPTRQRIGFGLVNRPFSATLGLDVNLST
jgi:hypothetical protein